MNDLSNSQLGQYHLYHVIGKGGMATVYRARQLSVGRDVAVKVLSPDLVGSDEFITRFEREAHIIAGLQHPHILTVYDFGREGHLVYLVMRLMEGGSLAKELATARRLSQQRVLTLVRQIASALDYAHTRGIVHRDLKPTNVLLDEDGNAYLTDFGIAKMVASNTVEGLTQPGSVMGTPSYMAPEQWRSEPVDGRTDLYALGIMTYQMLVGQVPFAAETPHGLMYLHLDREPAPPHTLNPALPLVVDQVIARALAKSPAHRYHAAPAFVHDLELALLAPDRFGMQPPVRPAPDVYDQFAEHDLMSRAGDGTYDPTVIPPGVPRRPADVPQRPTRPPSQGTPPGPTPTGQRPVTPPGAFTGRQTPPPQTPPPQTAPPTMHTPPQAAPPAALDQPAVRASQQPRFSAPGTSAAGAPPYATGQQPAAPRRRAGETGPLRSEALDTRAPGLGQEPTGLQLAAPPAGENAIVGCLRTIVLVVIGVALFGGVMLLIALALRAGGDEDQANGETPPPPSTAPATPTTQPGIPPNLQILSPQGEVTMQLGQVLPVQFVASSASGVTRVELRRFDQVLNAQPFSSVVEAQGTFSFQPESSGLHFLEIVPWSGSARGQSAQITVRVQP